MKAPAAGRPPTASAVIGLPDVGDVAPAHVIAACVDDLLFMLTNQQMPPTVFCWSALCDYFASRPECTPLRRVVFQALRRALRQAALHQVIVDHPSCSHLADSDRPSEHLYPDPCVRCGRYYVDG